MRYKVTFLYEDDGCNTSYVSPTNQKLKDILKKETGSEEIKISTSEPDLALRVVELLLTWEMVNCSMGNLDKFKSIQNELKALHEGRHLKDIFLTLSQSTDPKDLEIFKELEHRLKARKLRHIIERKNEGVPEQEP